MTWKRAVDILAVRQISAEIDKAEHIEQRNHNQCTSADIFKMIFFDASPDYLYTVDFISMHTAQQQDHRPWL